MEACLDERQKKASVEWNRKPYSASQYKKIDCSKKRTFDDVLVTPDLAKTMLSTMEKNRKLRSKYHEYALAMKKGRFDCAEAIGFDWNGHLINGQHRLNAVIEAGIPVFFDIKVGLSPDTIFDRGATRSLLDEAKIRGVVPDDLAQNYVLSMANTFLEFKFPHKHRTFNEDDRADFMNAYADYIRIAKEAVCLGSTNAPCRKGVIMAGILAAVIYGVDGTTINEYCTIANSGLPISGVDPLAQTAPLLMIKYIDGQKSHGLSKAKLGCVVEMTIRDFASGSGRSRAYKESQIEHFYMDKLKIEF